MHVYYSVEHCCYDLTRLNNTVNVVCCVIIIVRLMLFVQLFLLLYFSDSVAAHAEYNKMTLNNLATVFGPNLFRPGTSEDDPPNIAAAFDIMSPVNTLMFFLNCPEEVFDEIGPGSTPNSFSKSSSKKQLGLEEDNLSISSAQSSGYTTSLAVPTSPVGVSPSASSPTPLFNPPSSHALTTPTTVATTTPTSGPIRYKQSEI